MKPSRGRIDQDKYDWVEIPGSPKYYACREGFILGKFGRILQPWALRGGYRQVQTCSGRYCVHALIARCFIPNPDNKPQVNHKNSTRSDNCAENLEWVTAKENLAHAVAHDRMARGERNPNHKLTEASVRTIRAATGIPQRTLALEYGVSQATVWSVLHGDTWTRVAMSA